MFINSLLLIYFTDTGSSMISTNFDWPKSVTKLANISGLTVPNETWFLALIKEKLVTSNGKDNLMLCGDFSYRR